MTVLDDRIAMADSGDELTLDVMFEWLEKMPVLPKDGEYHAEVAFGFGHDIDLTGTPVGLVLRTGELPRDRD
ncbi:hypothetical protein [Streptomyces galbus]|uniref:Uncharacterized protein n=1 Tax=Streptomyces galbus TaxID=33898 RepID=A0ABX1IFZ3_STRGB|nr:hypothetical protein [Streptomyces galbus]NKQ24588.1 hypothetical protein [Streptomyces galbus]